MPAYDRLKLRHLHALVAVAEHGSVVRAAHALSVTQPAVSKTLAELEDIAGRPLFERSPKGVVLTAAGHLLLRHAGSSLRSIREGLDSVAIAEDAQAPTLRIGALPNVAATVLPPALLRFAREMPQARIGVRSGSNSQLIAALRQGVLDLVIGRLPEPSDMHGLSFEHLYTEQVLLVVRAGHALARRRRVPPEALRGLRMVLPDAGTRVREAVDRFLLASGIGLPTRALETIDVSFGRSYVLQSDALWCVPLGVVEGDLRQGLLQRLPFDTRASEGPVGLSRRVDAAPSPALERLVEEIRRSAGERAQAAG